MAVSLAMMAVPAKKGIWKTVRLADGTEVRVELCGDEFGHYWRAADGVGYQQSAETGVYERVDMQTLISRGEVRRAAAQQRRASVAPGGPQRIALGGTHDPYTGTKKGLIILVQFADKEFLEGHDRDLFDRIANEEGFSDSRGFVGSVRDYFLEQSGGQFTLDFDVVGPVTMPNGYAYYGSNDMFGNDRRVGAMIATACQSVDDEVDFSDYDWDGDGNVDQVFVLYAGRGENSGGGENTIWPHESELRYTSYGRTLKLDNVTINTYACSNELRTDTQIDGIGTICHEFSHCMGLPDMYDTAYGGNFGMAVWDLMDQGSYLGNGFIPCSYTSYERMYCGWQQPIELTADTDITGMKALSEGGDTYIMYNEGNRDEYYLFENRQRTGWDAGLYGSGLLIMHVDFDKSIWAYNYVNTTGSFNKHQRCTIFHADNSAGATAAEYAGDPYPYGSNNCLTLTSQPAATLYNANSDGSTMMDKSILDIERADDGTVSFSVRGNSNLSDNRPEGALFYESFDLCAGRGGNDGIWRSVGLGTAPLVPDNLGWTSPESYGGSACARFGSATQDGMAVTPAFEINGEAVMTFRAGLCTGDGNTLTLAINSGEATLSDDTFTMESAQWNDFTTTISGYGKVKVEFRTSQKRLYLDEVLVMPADKSAISGVKAGDNGQTDRRIYTLDGRFVGTDTSLLPKGIYIAGGKKIVKL